MLPQLRIWLDHFEYHSRHPRHLSETISNVLEDGERAAIANSIATFQLGEQSSGAHLLRVAYRFAEQHDAPALARITELLIREEQQHAALLKSFMAGHGIACRERHWTDTIFRRVRRLAGFELSLTVLLTAELIGNVYYRALEAATGCQRLRLMCRMMVADELAHIGFESDILMAVRAQRHSLLRWAIDVAHRTFSAGSSLVVWATHREVLRRAGYGMVSFTRACQAQYTFYLQPARMGAATGSAAE